jgi:hypothetical protein
LVEKERRRDDVARDTDNAATTASERRRFETGDDDPALLVDRAIENGDEHVVKFAEACVARHKIAPSPVYPAAIRHALGVVRRR